MTPGAKVFLALAGVGVVIGVIAVAAAPASAAPGQPKQPPQPLPGSPTPPDVVVPPLGTALPVPSQTPPGVPAASPLPPAVPLPPQPSQVTPSPALNLPNPLFTPPAVQTPPGVTQTLPNPIPGQPPLGTFDPATGNVFGPTGTIIGTFNPATGVFTGSGGFPQVQIPGFGPPQNVAPALPLPSPAPLPPAPAPAQVVPVAPPPAAAPAAAPVSTVEADTAAMVSALLDAETRPGWNTTDPTVGVWQKARPPLTVDSKYGPATSLTVAKTFGTLPLVRFWPANGQSKATLLNNYQQALLTLAAASPDPIHAAQLKASAAREDARAFSTKGALPALPVSMQVQLAKVA